MEVPPELRSLRQWVEWRYIGDDRKKVPFQPNGTPAKSNDPTTWSEFCQCHGQLGFVFAAEDGLFGVDLDGCIDDAGEVQEWAMRIVNRFDTYAEISPSGRGIKLWGRGAMPGGTGKKAPVNSPACCDKKSAIEAYDRGRYFTFTGERLPMAPLAVNDCQEALDWLASVYWPPKAAGVKPTQKTSIQERAARYLACVDPAIAGQGGHNQTFRAACSLVLGFGLTVDEAMPLLAEYNLRCEPPWSEKELLHKLESADKQTGERGFLINESTDYDQRPVDFSALVASQEVIEAEYVETKQAMMPCELLYPGGLIGDIVAYTLANSMYPQPELALAAAIALLSTITGRKVKDRADTRTNLYVVGLCPSGAGKDEARKTNKRLLAAAGATDMIGPEDIASSAGLIVQLDKNLTTLFQLDEMGRFIGYTQNPMAQHMQKVAGYLLKLYSSANSIMVGDAYADSKKVKTLHYPHCVVYGTSVPATFWESLTTSNVSEGLVGRMLVFDSFQGKTVLPRDNEVLDPPSSLVERVKWWVDYANTEAGNVVSKSNPCPRLLPRSEEAEQRFREHRLAIAMRRPDDQNEEVSTLWSRTAEKTAKLAMIFACSRSACEFPGQITIDDMNLAVKLSNWVTRMMAQKVEDHVSESRYEFELKKLLRKIGSGCTLNQLTRKTQSIDKRQRESIIADLVSSGRVVCELKEGVTKPTTYIRRLM